MSDQVRTFGLPVPCPVPPARVWCWWGRVSVFHPNLARAFRVGLMAAYAACLAGIVWLVATNLEF